MKVIMSEERQLDAYNKVLRKLKEIFHADVQLKFKIATLADNLGYVGNIIKWSSKGKSGWMKVNDFLSETDIPRIFHLDNTDRHLFKKQLKARTDIIDIYELATIILQAKTMVTDHKFNDI